MNTCSFGLHLLLKARSNQLPATICDCRSLLPGTTGKVRTMKKASLILVTAVSLGIGAIATPSSAEARGGFGPGLAGGLIAGALIGGIASNAYGYGPGYGYYGGNAPGYYGGYAPAYYRGYAPAYYGYGYRRVYRPAYVYYGGPRSSGGSRS